MIAYLSGTIHATLDRSVVLLAGGVGYRVNVPEGMLGTFAPGDAAELWIYTAMRESAIDLFGFRTADELRFFELLIGVSGIGPRSALGIIDLAPVATLASAIRSGDSAYLTKVSGIGAKTAQKIILELREKAAAFSEGTHPALAEEKDAIDALQSLGYSIREAQEALAAVSDGKTEERIREALKRLGKNR
ncbi:MAG TPA: Holliday junction branch migration protein RuvA [Candidatus Paceibacterota bacterium]|nr:Holliday junction branch migration protein RuvA [Candidatus Paceibacterota bacterium]